LTFSGAEHDIASGQELRVAQLTRWQSITLVAGEHALTHSGQGRTLARQAQQQLGIRLLGHAYDAGEGDARRFALGADTRAAINAQESVRRRDDGLVSTLFGAACPCQEQEAEQVGSRQSHAEMVSAASRRGKRASRTLRISPR
jgi:hypothetical protein